MVRTFPASERTSPLSRRSRSRSPRRSRSRSRSRSSSPEQPQGPSVTCTTIVDAADTYPPHRRFGTPDLFLFKKHTKNSSLRKQWLQQLADVEAGQRQVLLQGYEFLSSDGIASRVTKWAAPLFIGVNQKFIPHTAFPYILDEAKTGKPVVFTPGGVPVGPGVRQMKLKRVEFHPFTFDLPYGMPVQDVKDKYTPLVTIRYAEEPPYPEGWAPAAPPLPPLIQPGLALAAAPAPPPPPPPGPNVKVEYETDEECYSEEGEIGAEN